MHYRPDIDGLRAVAVLAVLFAHTEFGFMSGGFVGVDIFFVISGYLITGIVVREIEAGTFSLAGFYERRIRRILPALFVMMITCFIGGWFLLPPPQYEALGMSAIAATFFVSNFYFQRSSGDYFARDAEYEPLLHTWSLGVEEQFYIIAPLLLILFIKWREKWLIPAALTSVAASFALAAYATNNHPVANFYSTPTRAWELGIGGLLAIAAMPQIRSRLLAECIAVIGMAAIAASAVLYDGDTAFPGFAALPPVLGAALLIWVNGQHKTIMSRLLGLRPMVAIGLISYSLYLWHWPLVILARNFSTSLTIETGSALLVIGASLLLGWLSYRFVEKPFRNNSTSPSLFKRPFLLASLVGLGVSGVGAGIALNDGFWSRSPGSRAMYSAASTPDARMTECWRIVLAGKLAENPCPIGKPTSQTTAPSVVLWGDSHAAAFLPALHDNLSKRELAGVGIVKSGCAPTIGLDRSVARAVKNCPKFNLSAVTYIKESPHLQTVVLVARWPYWATGKRAKGESGGQANVHGITDKSRRYGTTSAALLEAGLEDVVTELREMGRDVVILSAVPEIGWNPPEKLLATDFSGLAMPLGPRLEHVRERQSSADIALSRVAQRTGARIIDVPGVFCGERCPVQERTELLYRDDDHLSKAGAAKLMSLIEKELFEDRSTEEQELP